MAKKNTNVPEEQKVDSVIDETAASTASSPEETQSAVDTDALKEALKAEILAELSADAQATPAKKVETNPEMEEYVTVQLFYDGKRYKDDVFVSVNGENCVVKRGVPVQIKKKFALVLEQSQMQDARAAEYAAAMQKECKEGALYLNI